MKIHPYNLRCLGKPGFAGLAFTLPEIMVSSALISMLVLGIVASNLFGIRLYEITKAKLGASDEARQAISKLVDEVRSAKDIDVGEGNINAFTQDIGGLQQMGRAMQIYPTTNTNFYIRYFWDPADKRLKRTTNGTTAYSVVANSISNQIVFTVEDSQGNILTNNQNNRVIGLMLQFYQIAYPIVNIPGPMFEYYQLRTKITRRVLE